MIDGRIDVRIAAAYDGVDSLPEQRVRRGGGGRVQGEGEPGGY